MSTKCEGTCDNCDGINQLPDDIFHYIISFLDVFDAVGISLVSKRWKDICCEMRYLDFDIPNFCHRRNLVGNYLLYENFKDFINWILLSRSSTRIFRFQLKCHSIFDRQQIFRWICVAASRNVQELILSFDPSEAFGLPFSLVTCDSLRVLKLHLFGRALQLPRYSGFCMLKCLHLDHLQLSEGDLARNLFSGCPLLENLTLRDCTLRDVKILDISSASIKYISVDHGLNPVEDDSYCDCAVKISCPNLLFFKYTGPIPRCYLLENLSLLQSIRIDPYFSYRTMSYEELGHFMCGVLKVVHNIIALKLCMEIIWGLYLVRDELILSLSMFHELKYLNLWLRIDETFMPVLMVLLKHSPNLETLNIYCEEMAEISIFKCEDCSRINCLTSHLRFVQLIDFGGEENEIEFVRILLENGLVLEKLIILCSYNAKISEIAEMVMKFPRSSSSVVVKVLYGYGYSVWLSL